MKQLLIPISFVISYSSLGKVNLFWDDAAINFDSLRPNYIIIKPKTARFVVMCKNMIFLNGQSFQSVCQPVNDSPRKFELKNL